MAVSNLVDSLFLETLVKARFYLELKIEDPSPASVAKGILTGTEFTDAVFLECKGFKRSMDVIEVTEVFPHKNKNFELIGTKIPGKAKTESVLTLSRGLSSSPTLWNWFNAVRDGNWGVSRRSGSITIYDQIGIPCVRLSFAKAWPASISVGDFKADSGEFAIETLELACEKVEHEDMTDAAIASRALQTAAMAARAIASPAIKAD